MILLGATLELTIIVGLFKSSGIIFVATQERFGSSASMTSIISTVTMATWSVTSLLVMNVGSKFLCSRTITAAGTVATCVAYVISSRAQDIKVLLFSNGIIQGAGVACMEPVALAMLGSYFEKHRGLACSIASSGGSLGGLLFAPLLTAMLEHYGYSGTMLLAGAFVLQCLITASLFRPQAFYLTREKKFQKRKREQDTRVHVLKENQAVMFNGDLVSVNQQSKVINISNNDHCFAENGNTQMEAPKHCEARLTDLLLVEERQRSYTDSKIDEVAGQSLRTNELGFSSAECIGVPQISLIDTTEANNDGVRHINNRISPKDLSCYQVISELFDFSLFKNPVFIIALFASTFMCVPCALSMVYLAPHAKDIGVEPEGIAKFLTIYSAIDMCSRISVGFTSDRKWMRRSTMIAISACILCAISHSMIFFTTFTWILVYSVIFGMFGGVSFAIFTAVILDYLPLAKLHSILGFIILIEAIFVSSAYAILGTLRDRTGSYIASFHFLGAMALVGGLLFAGLPLVERFHERKGNATFSCV